MELAKVKAVVNQSGKNGMKYGFFNLAASNGHELTKSELINIIKELDYAMATVVDSIETYNSITELALEELEDSETFE